MGEFLSNVSMRLKEFLDDNKILSVKIKESEKLREALDCDIDQTKDVMDKLTEERTAATREIQRHKEIIKGLQIKVNF